MSRHITSTKASGWKSGKPMTLEFVAANTKDPNWLVVLDTLLLTLVVLYGFVKLARAALHKPEAKNA
jgi:hypothetical protein